MKCVNVIPVLSAYQDGELDSALAGEVDLHLRDCPACRAEWQDLQELDRRLRRLPPPSVDPFFPTRVMAGLRPRPAGRRRLLQAAAYALIFVMIFLAGFFLQTSSAGTVKAETLPLATTYSAVLLEPQDLGLMAVHEKTLGLFSGSEHGQK
jgi:anti-sigma factor RsiW